MAGQRMSIACHPFATWGYGNEFTLSQSFCSSTIATGDSISGRMLNACPSFMYAGPKEVTISLNSIARATSFYLDRKKQRLDEKSKAKFKEVRPISQKMHDFADSRALYL